MLNIQLFVVNMIRENCYVVSDETNETVIIDCGALFPEECDNIQSYIARNQLQPKHLLCTHGHFDHIFGAEFIYKTYGLKPEINSADVMLYNNCAEQIKMFVGECVDIKTPIIGNYVDDDSIIKFGTHSFSVLSTPGHTPGGISFYCKEEKVVFTGDSIFRHSIGRTDFAYGDESVLIRKLRENVLTLPDETVIYPGHGHSTTIKEERAENPFFTTIY